MQISWLPCTGAPQRALRAACSRLPNGATVCGTVAAVDMSVLAVDMSVLAPDGVVVGWDEVGEGRPLLLVHGGVSDAGSWAFVRQNLPEGLRVAAMNRRGRGRSGRAEDLPHSWEVEANDVLAVAHSIGAAITLQALRRSSAQATGRADHWRGAV